MKIKKLLIGLVVGLCVLSLEACSIGGNDTNNKTDTQNLTQQNPNSQNPSAAQGNDSLPEDPTDINDADSLLSLASIKGSVVDFSKDSCTISPMISIDDGNGGGLAIGDAPGHENADAFVTVHYNDDCIFKIAHMSLATGAVTYEDIDISDIKKQTSLIIYGDWSNKDNINATAVYIARYE